MATPSWLEQELEELDQAERFIHETMSNFVPQSRAKTGETNCLCILSKRDTDMNACPFPYKFIE